GFDFLPGGKRFSFHEMVYSGNLGGAPNPLRYEFEILIPIPQGYTNWDTDANLGGVRIKSRWFSGSFPTDDFLLQLRVHDAFG
ncbi:MAG: hypothetical protein GTO30_12880, partial [Acidobacteria bacterium]|nr:hypothetical protein [Acidobacteriota bacterium]NIQ86245.1 hypothetical protein [Acidobacteriota bacterium]